LIRTSEAGPVALVCLGLQRGRLGFGGADRIVVACRRVMEGARARGWPVLHVHSRDTPADHGRPIAGLEPLASEAVFLRPGPSAFSNRAFSQAAQALGGPLALIGFALSDTILATAFAAADRDLRIDVIADAVAVGRREDPLLRAALHAPLEALGPLARLMDSTDLFEESAARFAAANLP